MKEYKSTENDASPIEIFLSINGEKFILNEANGWVTLSKYKELYHIANVNILMNWINRGIIPKDNVMTVPSLNDLKIIKAVPYNPRSYNKVSK